MDVKEKLMELIDIGSGCPDGMNPFGDSCESCRYYESTACHLERLADHLIANGVTVAEGKDTDEPLTICQQCFHRAACLAWIGHGKALYDDFVFSVDGCPYLEDAVKVVEIDQFNKWIPVTERKPDLELVDAKSDDIDLYPCLVTIEDVRVRNGRYVGKAWYDGEQFIDSDCMYITSNVTHWMPLPEPPED